MARLSMREIAALVWDVLPDAALTETATLTAIAQCESGGNTEAYNPNATNTPAYGLWQQNEGAGESLYDPPKAAAHMAATFHASRYRYWGCGPDHKSGYLVSMPPALLAAKATQGASLLTRNQTRASCEKRCREGWNPTDPGTRLFFRSCVRQCMKTGSTQLPPVTANVGKALLHNPLATLVEFLLKLFSGTTWIRIGEVVFGAFLLLIALWMISKDLGLGGLEDFTGKVPGVAASAGATAKIAAAMGAK